MDADIKGFFDNIYHAPNKTLTAEVVQALEKLGWIDSEQHMIPEEIYSKEILYEGSVKSITINAYKRNGVAREKCILNYGCTCIVCGLNLADIYGEIAQGYIHVHHLRQLSDINTKYEVDPIQDLRPVCPNCHAIIHTKILPYTIDEIKKIVKTHK
ncbi:HNH endonuclease [Candidatus Poribacteria bacterium]|nr:HNH endonuclease [Candidatus Poribacteria bacterium]